MAKPRLSIACIGGGISGLTLGQCLTRRGIPVVLYDRASSPRFHDYPITLYASAYKPLLQVLGVDEHQFKQKVSVDSTNVGKDESESTANKELFQANRGKLEAWLREGLDVRFGHQLKDVKLQSKSEGSCSALKFTNGSEVMADVVVGADGPHSTTRKSLLPQYELEALPYVAFNGRRVVSDAEFRSSYEGAMEHAGSICHNFGDTRVQLAINGASSDEVRMNWTYSRPTRGPSDPLHKPNRPTAGATDIPDEFYDEVNSTTPSATPHPLAEILDVTRLQKDRILHWVMRTILVAEADLAELAKKDVLLIGDATHAEAIIGGHGANLAIEDATSLADWIAEGKTLEDWYSTRYPTWQESHTKAKDRIQRLHASTSTSGFSSSTSLAQGIHFIDPKPQHPPTPSQNTLSSNDTTRPLPSPDSP